MTLTITRKIDIDTNDIIKKYNLTSNSTREEVYDAIQEYTEEFDDCDYYIIDFDAYGEIYKAIRAQIGEQFTMECV